MGEILEKSPEPFYSLPYQKNKGAPYWDKIADDLKQQKITPLAYKENSDEFIIIISNIKYTAKTQAIGRSLRILSKYVPKTKNYFL